MAFPKNFICVTFQRTADFQPHGLAAFSPTWRSGVSWLETPEPKKFRFWGVDPNCSWWLGEFVIIFPIEMISCGSFLSMDQNDAVKRHLPEIFAKVWLLDGNLMAT